MWSLRAIMWAIALLACAALLIRLRVIRLRPETTQQLGNTIASALRVNFPHVGQVVDTLSADPAVQEFLPTTLPDKVAEKDSPSRSYAAPPPKGFESKGERACRRIFEDLFERPFPRMSRCKFLRNPYTGGYMELDGINEELGLAFEFDGVQHHEYPAYGGQTEKEFLAQVYRDDLRRRLCDKANIYLIRIPYTVKIKDMWQYILKRLPATVTPFLVGLGPSEEVE